jgi:hypothetical protein
VLWQERENCRWSAIFVQSINLPATAATRATGADKAMNRWHLHIKNGTNLIEHFESQFFQDSYRQIPINFPAKSRIKRQSANKIPPHA